MDRVDTPPRRRDSANPVIAGYQDLLDTARRVIRRTMLGRHDIASQLVFRELESGRPDRAYGLALALTEHALAAVADSRHEAARLGVVWEPALYDGHGLWVTPTSGDDGPRGHAVAMLEAMHRYLSGDKAAVEHLGRIYGSALHSPGDGLFEFYSHLIDYAVQGERGTVRVGHVAADPEAD